MSEQQWHHPDWNKPEGQRLREQLERSKRVRAEWRLTERKDARVAAFIVAAVCVFLLLPVCMNWLAYSNAGLDLHARVDMAVFAMMHRLAVRVR